MGSLHHAHATTTVRVRKDIQDSSATIAVLATRYHINPKTVGGQVFLNSSSKCNTFSNKWDEEIVE